MAAWKWNHVKKVHQQRLHFKLYIAILNMWIVNYFVSASYTSSQFISPLQKPPWKLIYKTLFPLSPGSCSFNSGDRWILQCSFRWSRCHFYNEERVLNDHDTEKFAGWWDFTWEWQTNTTYHEVFSMACRQHIHKHIRAAQNRRGQIKLV